MPDVERCPRPLRVHAPRQPAPRSRCPEVRKKRCRRLALSRRSAPARQAHWSMRCCRAPAPRVSRVEVSPPPVDRDTSTFPEPTAVPRLAASMPPSVLSRRRAPSDRQASSQPGSRLQPQRRRPYLHQSLHAGATVPFAVRARRVGGAEGLGAAVRARVREVGALLPAGGAPAFGGDAKIRGLVSIRHGQSPRPIQRAR